MLKIKDNVDLKELEKFGFKRDIKESPTWRSKWAENKEKYVGEKYTEIGYVFDDGRNEIIVIESRINSDWHHLEQPRQLYVRESDYDMGVSMYIYDKVFDLIQAGLVEKVSD